MAKQAVLTVKLETTYELSDDFNGGTTRKANIDFEKTITLGDGVGADQFDLQWRDRRTVADGVPDDIDLAGVLLDGLGTTLTFVEIVAIIISKVSGTGPLEVGGDAAPLVNWVADGSDIINVGELLVLTKADAGGYGVTATTGDILQIANNGGDSVVYDIVVLGRGS